MVHLESSLFTFIQESIELDSVDCVHTMRPKINFEVRVCRTMKSRNSVKSNASMTTSEIEWSEILTLNGLNFAYEPGPRNGTKPDYSFQLGHGDTVYSEVKECKPNDLDHEVLSGHRSGFWGAREGRNEVRPTGRVDRTGWGGHFLKAAKQLQGASQSGHQTLIVFRSYSLTADLDATDILLFLFGYHYRRISDCRFRIEREKWGDDDMPLPMVSFAEFANVSGLAYLKDKAFRLFANPLANVQLDSQSFACLAGCSQVSELDFASTFHAVWRVWEPGYRRLTCDP